MLFPHLFWIWQAFSDLSYRRGAGYGGPLPINYSDIAAYCSLKSIIMAGDKERLVRFIETLDREYMASSYERMKSETPTPSSKPNASRHDVPRHRRRAPTQELTP